VSKSPLCTYGIYASTFLTNAIVESHALHRLMASLGASFCVCSKCWVAELMPPGTVEPVILTLAYMD
jgi:hypothetical protein